MGSARLSRCEPRRLGPGALPVARCQRGSQAQPAVRSRSAPEQRGAAPPRGHTGKCGPRGPRGGAAGALAKAPLQLLSWGLRFRGPPSPRASPLLQASGSRPSV